MFYLIFDKLGDQPALCPEVDETIRLITMTGHLLPHLWRQIYRRHYTRDASITNLDCVATASVKAGSRGKG